MEMCKCESRGQKQTASADNTQISWCIDPDWDTAVRGGAGDPHGSSREQAQACAALLCAARPAWPSGCAVLPVSRGRRVTSASWLQQRSLQAAPARHQPLRHLRILARVQQGSQKFSRQQPLGAELFSQKKIHNSSKDQKRGTSPQTGSAERAVGKSMPAPSSAEPIYSAQHQKGHKIYSLSIFLFLFL